MNITWFKMGKQTAQAKEVYSVASVPVRSGRNSNEKGVLYIPTAKNGARAKRWKEGAGGGERRERLPANPSILEGNHESDLFVTGMITDQIGPQSLVTN